MFRKSTTIFIAILLLFAAVSVTDAKALLSDKQISAVISLLKVFNVDSKTLDKVESVLSGKEPVPQVIKDEYCPRLYRNLYLGAKGEDVKQVQSFLKKLGYYKYPEITGYFGPATEMALQEFQKDKQIVRGGSPETTGFGVLGPKTRRMIQNVCGEPGPEPGPVKPPVLCTMEYAPVCGIKSFCPPGAKCLAPEMMKTYSNICMLRADGAKLLHKGACKQDIPSDDNKITIQSFTGPVKLSVGQRGKWKISASNSKNKPLRYKISWGDEYAMRLDYAQKTMPQEEVKQDNEFTHSYLKPGTYKMKVTVYADGAKPEYVSSTVKVVDDTDFDNDFSVSDVTVDKKEYYIDESVEVSWKVSGNMENKKLTLALRNAKSGRTYKARAVDPDKLRYSFVIDDHFCNSFFSDAIDGVCGTLKSDIQNGLDEFYIEAKAYSPYNACLGYCIPGTRPTWWSEKSKSEVFKIKLR